ncbi:hypothetical protein TIFTF001_054831 [Ficus carica]|uniref:DUF630 domain-containing protein n=1 Tax=Ficus carica TaxID=3494 RepID=A0AA88EES0_FICCA|nr:hypothetical protein TIFTF001_054831 [Ficus carica]
MGCTALKLDNKDMVRRCKERLRLMKEAVDARHYLAAAHTDYFRSLRLTSSALSSFAFFEPPLRLRLDPRHLPPPSSTTL